MIIRVFCITISVLICSCGVTKFSYSGGDGKFTDFGSSLGAGRYRLDLGKIDLSEKSKNIYLIGDLPNETLGLWLDYKSEEANNFQKIKYRISDVKIHIRIIIKDTGNVAYEYLGNLYKDGYRNGEYYREGLDLLGGERAGYKKLSHKIQYSFNDKYKLYGIETPFFVNCKRIIEIEIIKPQQNKFKDTMDIVIFGGGWQ